MHSNSLVYLSILTGNMQKRASVAPLTQEVQTGRSCLEARKWFFFVKPVIALGAGENILNSGADLVPHLDPGIFC